MDRRIGEHQSYLMESLSDHKRRRNLRIKRPFSSNIEVPVSLSDKKIIQERYVVILSARWAKQKKKGAKVNRCKSFDSCAFVWNSIGRISAAITLRLLTPLASKVGGKSDVTLLFNGDDSFQINDTS